MVYLEQAAHLKSWKNLNDKSGVFVCASFETVMLDKTAACKFLEIVRPDAEQADIFETPSTWKARYILDYDAAWKVIKFDFVRWIYLVFEEYPLEGNIKNLQVMKDGHGYKFKFDLLKQPNRTTDIDLFLFASEKEENATSGKVTAVARPLDISSTPITELQNQQAREKAAEAKTIE